jgi:hypothetical protein
VRVTGDLLDVDREVREIFPTPPVGKWLDARLPDVETDGFFEGALCPVDQAMDLFRRFRTGDMFRGDFAPKPLNPRGRHVWELRTPDLRFFGWFHRVGVFVIAGVATKADLATARLSYSGFVEQTSFLRGQLELEEPKFVDGELEDVIQLSEKTKRY